MQKIIQLPLQQIQSNLEREDFAEEWLEEVAQALLDTGVLLTPLIVEQLEDKQYIVLDKDLEFFAALKASEMDSNFTQVSAYVVESETQLDAAEFQLQILSSNDDNISNQDIVVILHAMLEQLIQLSESDNAVSKADIDALKSEFSVHIFSLMQAIEQNGSQFNSLFEVLGEIDNQIEQTLVKVSTLAETGITMPAPVVNTTNPVDEFIQAVNTLPIDILERKLKATGANKVFIENLIAVRDVESFVPFSTIEELLKIKGIGDKSLLKTLSHWNK